jgi:hypothetical protein
VDNVRKPCGAKYDSGMAREINYHDVYIDANGCLTERLELDGQPVIVHYDDIPDSDITTVGGVACTTPLRTVLDIALEIDAVELERIVEHCLERGLFSKHEAMARIAMPDMSTRPGAELLRRALHR